MKKIVWYLFSLVLMITFTSCNENKSNEQKKDKETVNKEIKTINLDLAESVKAGEKIYLGKGNCIICHMENGEGVAVAIPPLSDDDYLSKNPKKIISIIINGLKDTIKVNEREYSQAMPPTSGLTNIEVRDLSNYILNSWGNSAGQITLKDVKSISQK